MFKYCTVYFQVFSINQSNLITIRLDFLQFLLNFTEGLHKLDYLAKFQNNSKICIFMSHWSSAQS